MITPVENGMRQIIQARLQEIESLQQIKILYACESGSRAWGFPSADSDSHYAVTVVIPFRGESDYVAIYYGVTSGTEKAAAVSVLGIENSACAITADCCTETTGEVQFRYYYVEQSVVKVKDGAGNPCTWNCLSSCVQYYGLSPLAAAGCISACISCFLSAWPDCIICSACGGVVVGCAAACCLE